MSFNTIHVFGYGETQIIKADGSKKVASSSLATLQALVDHVESMKPEEVNIEDGYHVIHIMNGMNVQYLGKMPEGVNGRMNRETKRSFRVDYKDVNHDFINNLVAELEAAQ
jgi:hypothetical protein